MSSKLFNQDSIKESYDARDRWKKKVSDFEKKTNNDKEYKTLSGIPVEPMYTPEHVADMDYGKDLGFPGEPPFVRGVYPTMYRGRTWTMRQLAGFSTAELTNKRYKLLLKEGATGINGIFDYPTLRGYDSTDPMARADCGRGGVAIDTLEDMRILFDGIPLDKVSTSIVTCQPIGNITVQSMYFANAKNRGIPLNNLIGTSQNDFLMETCMATAPGVSPPNFAFKLSCDAIEFCAKYAKRWNPVSFAGYNYRETGCTAPQEVAFVIANALACAEEMLKRGLNIDEFASRLSFFMNGHNDFFEEIAKYRAARRVWARIMKERFNPKDPRSMAFRFHVQTAGVALTAQQPLNNIARSAYHAMAAVLGGAQSVHVDGYDEALCIPTELSSITALRVNQILQLETGVTRTIDPLGGSYFVEALTNQLEEQIVKIIGDVDRAGGIVKATESGRIHRSISDAAYEYQQNIDTGKMPVVGVNCNVIENEVLPIELFEVPETLSHQEKRINKIKKERSAAGVQKAMDDISRCCDEDNNLMEVIVEAVQANITEGEITGKLREKYGTWDPPLF